MPYYRCAGVVPAKRHTQFRTPAGGLYYEELMGQEGFSSDSSLLYHRGVPVGDRRREPVGAARPDAPPRTPRCCRATSRCTPCSRARSTRRTDAVTGRRLVLGNADVRISYVVAGETIPLYRNALGDECVYVESGTGTVETVFGALEVRQGDYVVLPRATTHRWLPAGAEPLRCYVIEANRHIAPPARYLSRYGQLLEHAPYCERDLHGPGEPLVASDGDRRRGPGQAPRLALGLAGTRYVVPTHPFDVVGWDGCLYPYTFNIADFEPITGRVHQPPPVHQVFEGANFVICNFVPRKVDYHPLSVPVPYYHSNVDSDEVMFYSAATTRPARARASARARSACTPAATRTARSPARSSVRWARSTSTSSPSWSTPSARSSSARAGIAADDGRYAWTWSGRGPGR